MTVLCFPGLPSHVQAPCSFSSRKDKLEGTIGWWWWLFFVYPHPNINFPEVSLIAWLHPPSTTLMDSNTHLPLRSIFHSKENTKAKRSTSSRLRIFITRQLILRSFVVLQECDNRIMSFMGRKRMNLKFIFSYSSAAPTKTKQNWRRFVNTGYSSGSHIIQYRFNTLFIENSVLIATW